MAVFPGLRCQFRNHRLEDARSTPRHRVDTTLTSLITIHYQNFLSIQPLSLVEEHPVNGGSIASFKRESPLDKSKQGVC